MNKTNLGNKEIFSRNLNRYLSLSGKTQKEVAAAVGISTGTFCDWTKGRAYPRMDKVQALAEYFGISKSDLVEDVNVARGTINDKQQKVLDLFHKIPDDKKDFAIKMLETIADNQ
jgi:transcriptional regulator with XRE-family HTH domain